MEIRRLFGKQNNETAVNTNSKQSEQVINDQESLVKQIEIENIQAGKGEDIISISAFSRQLSQISKIVDQDEASRGDRIAKIKQAIADGTYNVSSTDVAKSLISYSFE